MQGKVPILSTEAIHQLHIFIFALAVTHVVLSAVTLILGVTQVFKREALCSKRLITSISKYFVHLDHDPDKKMETLGGEDPTN